MKRCPFCQSLPEKINGNVRCVNDECAISRWWVPEEEWQKRKSFLSCFIEKIWRSLLSVRKSDSKSEKLGSTPKCAK